MAEYIDREKLLDELSKSASYHAENGREYQLLLRDRNIVREQKEIRAIPILKGATNGDVIMTLFDCMVIEISKGKVYVEHIYFPFDENWWNAPYESEGE